MTRQGGTDESGKPTVFVVENDRDVGTFLTALVASAGLRAEAYPGAADFLAAFDEARRGCVVTDMRLPEMSGLQLLEHLAGRGSTLPVIILSSFGDVPTAVRAIKAGAADFIEKPFRAQHLLDSIHAALTLNATRRRRQAERQAARARLAALTPREREVLALIVAGHPNKVIAARLGISANTVENHRSRLLKKSGAGNVAGLVRLTMVAGSGEGAADGNPR